jgi:hypothetical protein
MARALRKTLLAFSCLQLQRRLVVDVHEGIALGKPFISQETKYAIKRYVSNWLT